MNIEAQNSLGRFRSRQYDLGPRARDPLQVPALEARNGGRGKLAVGVAFQKTRTGARVRVELANQYGWKVGDHIPLMSCTAQLSGPTDWANATLTWRKIRIVRPEFAPDAGPDERLC